jgi:oxidoreductase
LLDSPQWVEVAVITRRIIDEWKPLLEDANKKNRFKIIERENLDELADISKWELESGYDVFFCCLGTTRGKAGKQGFYKVDYKYVVSSAKLAIHFKIPHYSLVTSQGADKSSCFFYLSTKGKAEHEIS